jgi:signal peptidase II
MSQRIVTPEQRAVALLRALAYENCMAEVTRAQDAHASGDARLSGEGPASEPSTAAPAAGAPESGDDSTGNQAEAARRERTRTRQSFIFFAATAAVCLLADVSSKAWAEVALTRRTPLDPMVLVEHHLNFALAYNRGGAWGLLQNASETLRRPFFLLVSMAAIAFIVSLYAKLQPGQRALRWGLPLVLGGALGNLADRVTRGSVVDFIDYRADWVQSMNELIARVVSGWNVTDHWPTFNVADVSICIGVGLMAVDMLTAGRRNAEARGAASTPPAPRDNA